MKTPEERARECVAPLVKHIAMRSYLAATYDAIYYAVVDAIGEAVKEEREACAKVADSLYDKTYWDDPYAGIASAIRARGDAP